MELTYTNGTTVDWSTTTKTATTDNTMWTTGFARTVIYPDYWSGGSWTPPEKKFDWDDIKKILEENEEAQRQKEDKLMRVYEVIVVDAKECEILKQQNVVSKDTETAMLEVDLTPEMRKKVKKGEVKFIFNELGSFEKVERQIRVKELVEDDE